MRKEIGLLEETKSRHPDGIVEGRLVTLIDWGRDFKSAEMVEMLKEYWEPKNVNDLYIINLKGIDILIPSAAKTLVEASSVLGALWKRPVVFTNAEPGVKESLETQANRFNPAIKLLWEDEMEKSNPRKLQWKNEEITTSLTDEEAAKLVESKVDSDFAKSLVSKFKSQTLSTGQLFWLHKLAEQATTISQPVEVGGIFQAVTRMMEKASTKLQKPRIRVLAEEQQEIKLYPADSDSKYAGSIMLYAVGGFLGTIDKTGTFRPAKGCPAWVLPALQKFANNPHHTAQEYGTLTGRCCFCYQRLSTETSLSLGYGPICARNYGLLK